MLQMYPKALQLFPFHILLLVYTIPLLSSAGLASHVSAGPGTFTRPHYDDVRASRPLPQPMPTACVNEISQAHA